MLIEPIAGLEEISDGEAMIDGKVVNNIPPKNRDIAYAMAKANTERYIYDEAAKDGLVDTINRSELLNIRILSTVLVICRNG